MKDKAKEAGVYKRKSLNVRSTDMGGVEGGRSLSARRQRSFATPAATASVLYSL